MSSPPSALNLSFSPPPMKTSLPAIGIVAERIEVVAGRAVGGAVLDPVVALVAHILFVGLAAEDEVVARPPKASDCVLAGDDEVAAEAADDQVDAVAALDDVVAVAALDVVVAARVGDDVVAGAAAELVVAVAAVDAGRCRRRPRSCRRRSLEMMMSLPAVPPSTTWSSPGVVQVVRIRARACSGLSRMTSGVSSMGQIVMPPVGDVVDVPHAVGTGVNCFGLGRPRG